MFINTRTMFTITCPIFTFNNSYATCINNYANNDHPIYVYNYAQHIDVFNNFIVLKKSIATTYIPKVERIKSSIDNLIHYI